MIVSWKSRHRRRTELWDGTSRLGWHLQSAWALLLHCASARANYFLRVVRPELVSEFAEGHDERLWRCLCRMLGTDFGNEHSHEVASMSFSLGGLGLRSATRTRQAAYWASWADCLSMIKVRHPAVAERILVALHSFKGAESIRSAAMAANQLAGVEGFEVPSWESLSEGARPEFRKPEDHEPGGVRHGWQHEAASRVERHHRKHNLMVRLAPHEKALVRSQSGRDVFGGSFELLDPHRPCLVPCAPLATSPSPAPSRFTPVPMWPSIGFLWPPSCGVFQSWRVGQARLCC